MYSAYYDVEDVDNHLSASHYEKIFNLKEPPAPTPNIYSLLPQKQDDPNSFDKFVKSLTKEQKA